MPSIDNASKTGAMALLLALISMPTLAGPTVVPTAEGQFGAVPGVDDRLLGARFESIRGEPGDILFGGIFIGGGSPPPAPEVQFLTDMIHGYPEPVPVGETSSLFEKVDKVVPASAWSRNAADDGDFVAFSFAVDGAMPQTLTVRIATFDESGNTRAQVPIAENVDTFMFLDPIFAKTGVAVDNQGRTTVTWTEFAAGLPRVRAMRLDAGGTVINPTFDATDNIHGNPDVVLLDPAGNRLIVVTNDLINPPNVRGNIIDFSGGTPTVLPEFRMNETGAPFGALNPAVAADPATGNFTVVWEDNTGVQGNPVDVLGRRFDADGNPIGGDFVVNTSTANAQGQQAVAYGPESLSAVVWAGDPLVPQQPDDLDIFLQVYGPDGQPIGGQIQVNTSEDDIQDRPAVRFLPDRDAQGRPQVAVIWRDVTTPDGGGAKGTGRSYRCFSINGFEEEVPIFADGFESGDTSSWSQTTTP